MNDEERLDGFEPISPELVLVDPELAARIRALPVQHTAPSALHATSRHHGRRLPGLLASAAATAILGAAVAAGILAGPHEIGRAHVWTPVTVESRMPSSA